MFGWVHRAVRVAESCLGAIAAPMTLITMAMVANRHGHAVRGYRPLAGHDLASIFDEQRPA